MKKYLIIILIIFAADLFTNAIFGQTIIKDRIVKLSKKDYKECYSGNWDLKIPVFSTLSRKDARHLINDSINKIVKPILADTLNYTHNIADYSSDCDTNTFTNPDEFGIYYMVGQNSGKILSVNMFVNYSAGAGGMGFGTKCYSFNVDIVNNKMLSINSLFDSTNTKKLLKYVSENIESPNEGISLDEDFNIFGSSNDYPGYGSYSYTGFRVDNNSLILYYTYDFGRGDGLNEIVLPLRDIKSFINPKYSWLCERDK